MDDDLYAVLGVPKSATEDDIRKAYRKLARKHHPDVNPGDAKAEARFKRISAAYEVLSKPEKRALYDELGPDAAKIGFDPEKAEEYRAWKRQAEQMRGGRAQPGYEGFGGFGGYGAEPFDLEDLFGELFAQRERRRRGGGDVEASLRIPFELAVRGGSTTIELPRQGPSGRVETERLVVTIPAGIDEGQRLRLAGKGMGQGTGQGDLYVRIEVEPHPSWRREGLDLAIEVPISVPEALAGAQIDVPTLDGGVKLKVPAGAQNGQKLRLRGKGVRGEGDLIVTLRVVMPRGGSSADRERLARELLRLYDEDVRADWPAREGSRR
ncbi:MAG: J domain-containing protein [Sandaracinaceae bacterium]|nr:J domain-containing protein [Sandaracinaceae bacterium]